VDTIKRVYDLAEEKEISLYQLAKDSGISLATIKAAEKRSGQLKIDTIEKICEALGITLSAFFAERES
jgi:transcriptional regulator with XRE-family HTH domain